MTIDQDEFLRGAVHVMHSELARRDNISSVTVKNMARLGKSLPEAIAAGLLTTGTTHAPIEQATRLLVSYNRHAMVDTLLAQDRKIPGFGSSFSKGRPDPIIEQVPDYLDDDLFRVVKSLEAYVQNETGKDIYPNAALATAAIARSLNMEPTQAPRLLIEGRIDAWCALHFNNFQEGPGDA